MKNGFEIIDAHCHIYPAKIAAAASAHTGEFYSIPMAFDGTVESLLEEGDGAGIDRYLVQSVAVTAKQVRSINRYIAGEVEKSGGKFIGFGTLHPDRSRGAYLARASRSEASSGYAEFQDRRLPLSEDV